MLIPESANHFKTKCKSESLYWESLQSKYDKIQFFLSKTTQRQIQTTWNIVHYSHRIAYQPRSGTATGFPPQNPGKILIWSGAR